MIEQHSTIIESESRLEPWVNDLELVVPPDAHDHCHDDLTNTKKIKLGVRRYPDGAEEVFEAALTEPMLKVFVEAARVLGEPLLPPGPHPLEAIRCFSCNEWGSPIVDLERPLDFFLGSGCSRHFSLEYLLVVKINTKWGVAPSRKPTPRELLMAFGFSAAEFSLYKLDSCDPLPPDEPLSLKRGDAFEAQKDGRYGEATGSPRQRGFQTIEDDVNGCFEGGVNARVLTAGGQTYVEVSDLEVPSPPWSRNVVSILISIPSTYPSGSLDAFYLEQPLSHSSGAIPGQQSNVFINGKAWSLISWHYAAARQWNPVQDDLATHIAHCRGYLLRRGIAQ